jgi:hypothetical protein
MPEEHCRNLSTSDVTPFGRSAYAQDERHKDHDPTRAGRYFQISAIIVFAEPQKRDPRFRLLLSFGA